MDYTMVVTIAGTFALLVTGLNLWRAELRAKKWENVAKKWESIANESISAQQELLRKLEAK